jgi:diguanylate cyclase (GGDEF)-like protein
VERKGRNGSNAWRILSEGLIVKILIADHVDVSRLKLESLLTGWGYEVVAVEDGTEAWNLLQREDAPRLAILDWTMPGIDGPEICRLVRKAQHTPYTYLIILTAKSHREDIILGMDAGADDYVNKPFDAQELKVRLRAGQRIVELEEALRVQATHDALTGAWNRGAIMEMLARELARSKREGSSLGVVLADLDEFKQVNDRHGHLAGDEVLRAAAQRMSRVIRSYDFLGRYGGEEFLVLLPRCKLADAVGLAERLRRCVAALPVATTAGEVCCTVSLGVTASAGEEQAGAEAILHRADQALYQAKRLGRNRVAVSPSLA